MSGKKFKSETIRILIIILFLLSSTYFLNASLIKKRQLKMYKDIIINKHSDNYYKQRKLSSVSYVNVASDNSSDYWFTTKIDNFSFIIVGFKAHIYTNINGIWTLQLPIDHPSIPMNSRVCLVLPNNKIVIPISGLYAVNRNFNSVYKKNQNGIYQYDSIESFDTDITSIAVNIKKITNDFEYLIMSTWEEAIYYSKILIWKQVNQKYQLHDYFNQSDKFNQIEVFDNKYVFINLHTTNTVNVYKLGSDYKLSTLNIHQTLTLSVIISVAIENLDNSVLLIGLSNGKIARYKLVNDNFIFLNEWDTNYNVGITSITKINKSKLAISLGGFGLGIFYIQGDNIKLDHLIGPLGPNAFGKPAFINGDTIVLIVLAGDYFIKKLTCQNDQILDDYNCIYCSTNTYLNNNVCYHKCFSIGTKPDLTNKCELCGTEYNDGPLYNKLDILNDKCVVECPDNLISSSIINSNSYICRCKENQIFKDKQCVDSSLTCGKSGFLNEFNICIYCPSTLEEYNASKIYNFNGTCVADCPSDFIKNSEIFGKYFCETCGEKNQYLLNNECIQVCPSVYIKNNIQNINLWKCLQSCYKSYYISETKECLSCPTNMQFVGINAQNKEQCFATCPVNYTTDITNMRCIKCTDGYVVFNNECIDCSKNTNGKTISYNNECIAFCPNSTIYNSTTKTCDNTPNINNSSNVNMQADCLNFITILDNGNKKCTDECDNQNNYYISNSKLNVCVQCKTEESFINKEFKKCVKICETNYGTDSKNFASGSIEDLTCKKCEDLSINKINFIGECIKDCPDKFELVENQCKIILKEPECNDFCLNNGICSIKNGKLSCDCSGTGYIGNKCHLNFNDLNKESVNLNIKLDNEEYENVSEIIENIPEFNTEIFFNEIYLRTEKALNDIISGNKSYDKEILKLVDLFYLSSKS